MRNSPIPPTSPDHHPWVMAMYSGPGPAAYNLPGTTGQTDHDPSKKKSPAFSFGNRTKQGSAAASYQRSPGPIYYIAPSMTRRGKDGAPSYTLHSRFSDPANNASPGPAAYHTGLHNPSNKATAPIYSFGMKTGGIFRKTDTPAPNRYTLPSLLGDKVVEKVTNPSYSMTGRPRHQDLCKTPGPGTYKTVNPDIYSSKSPEYSMHIRNPTASSYTNTPGPGAHRPEKVTVCHRQMPMFSFGIKHSMYMAPLIEKFVD